MWNIRSSIKFSIKFVFNRFKESSYNEISLQTPRGSTSFICLFEGYCKTFKNEVKQNKHANKQKTQLSFLSRHTIFNTENCGGEMLAILLMNGAIQEKGNLMLKSLNPLMVCALQITQGKITEPCG